MTTLFSQVRFVEAIARTDRRFRPIVLDGLNAIEETSRFGRRIHLAPWGLPASPDAGSSATAEAVRRVVEQLKTLRTISFRWNVRFDHGHVALALRELGISADEVGTRVLAVSKNYEAVFAGYNSTRRNEVRRAAREGVTVRDARDDASVRAYYAIHRTLSALKARHDDYPIGVFQELLKLPEASLLVAEVKGVIIGGGVFFRDGNSLFYWHGASDRNYVGSFPTCAVLDRAIHVACDAGLSTVNFGGSLGISSLDDFKASWGARPAMSWKFNWNNPVWKAARRIGALAGAVRARLRRG